MRWKSLFDDVEAQFEAAEQAALESEVADRFRSEQATLGLVDRMRGQIGLVLKVAVSNGRVFTGELTHVGSEWLVLSSAAEEVIVPFHAVQLVEGLGRTVALEASRLQQALGLSSALRTLSRDRAPVTLHRVGSELRVEGVIDRVGKDFVELAEVLPGEQRRRTGVSSVFAVPFRSIAAISTR